MSSDRCIEIAEKIEHELFSAPNCDKEETL